MSNEATAQGAVGTVYAAEDGVEILDYSMSDRDVDQYYGWLQTGHTKRVRVCWSQISHTAFAWRRTDD